MNIDTQAVLDWIDQQQETMVGRVTRWAGINTHTYNLEGLEQFTRELQPAFACFDEKIETLFLPAIQFIDGQGQIEVKQLGRALKICKRPQAKHQALLVIHLDTVYPVHKVPAVISREENNLLGPGVADAKGGIAVLLTALEGFEQFSKKENLGWTVLLNPDEEIGSPGSQPLLGQLAMNAQVGLVFEPSLPRGDLVGNRKGSGNFTLVIRGRSAHAGRDIQLGRNAIEVLAKAVTKIAALNNTRPGLIVNVGVVEGGRALNVVPDVALARFNIRIEKQDDEAHAWIELKKIIAECHERDGIKAELHGGFFAPPKILTGKTLTLYQNVQRCADELGFKIEWHPSGGVCDGNRLAALGLPNVDTLGAVGGEIHSPQEYLRIDRLTERAKLAALILMNIATGEISI